MAAALGFRSSGTLHRPAAGPSGRALAPCAPPHGAVFVGAAPRSCWRRTARKYSTTVRCAAQTVDGQQSYSITEVVRARKNLQQELEAAVKAEDYSLAADLKRRLNELDSADPIVQAKKALEQAIKEERYQDAAKLQAQLKQLEAELGAAALDSDLLSTSSNTVTRGIRVKVQSYFLPSQSDPRSDRYLFAYAITISNESQQTVQLKQRHWVIMDGNGKVEEVRGPGVVGAMPVINPGKSFEYSSGCPLTTSQGCMEGEFTMTVLNEEDGLWKETMEVKIGRFKLDSKGPAAV